MKFEKINVTPQFDIFVAKDSESEEKPTIILQYGEVSFSVTTDILNQNEELKLKILSTGSDIAQDEIDRLREYAIPQAERYRQNLRDKYSEYFA